VEEKINNLYKISARAYEIGYYDPKSRTPELLNKITDSYHAFWWAVYIGNYDIMLPRITHPYYQKGWIRNFSHLHEPLDEWLISAALNNI